MSESKLENSPGPAKVEKRTASAILLECPKSDCSNKTSISADFDGYLAHCRRCGTTFKIDASIANVSTHVGPTAQKTPYPVAIGFAPPFAFQDEAFQLKAPDPSVPSQIARFQIRGRLGAGTFGTVYRAYDPQLDREVALKVPQPGSLDTPKRVERFLGDAKAAARLRHPHIVPVYDAGWDGSHYYIASAFIEGRTLAEAMEAGELTLRHSVQVIRSLAEALAYAHTLGIVHRDVKPANVMLDEKGQPHLIDFGLAHRRDSLEKEQPLREEVPRRSELSSSAGQTKDGTVLGTPAYMAPEQAAGRSRNAQPASDQYSLGVMLYELLCGQTPFSGPLKILLFNVIHTEPLAPSNVKPGVSRDLEVICLKALAKRAEHRFVGCQEMADDLRRWLEGEPILARRPSKIERLARWCRREPKLAGALAVAGAAIVAVAALSVTFGLFQSRSVKQLRIAYDEANEQRELADRSAHETKIALAARTFDWGYTKCEQGDIGRGMNWLARSLQIAYQPGVENLPEAKHLQHDIRVNLAGWRRQLHPLINSHSHPNSRFWAMAYSPTGETILTGSGDEDGANGKAQIWDARLENLVRTFQEPGQGLVRAVAYTNNGNVVLTGSDDGHLRLWNAATGDLIAKCQHEGKRINGLALSPDGQTIATACEDGLVRLWETAPERSNLDLLVQAGRDIQVVKKFEHPGPVLAIAHSPDGHTILTGTGRTRLEGEARLWSVAKGNFVKLPRDLPVNAVAFSPNGEHFATGCGALFQGYATIWNTVTCQPVGAPLAHQAEVYALAFTPDSKALVTAGQDRAARLWQVPTGKPSGQPLWHSRDVRLVAIHPDGRTLLTDTDDQTTRIWELSVGRLPFRTFLHKGIILTALFSPDGKMILTGGTDQIGKGIAKLWNLATGELIASFPHEYPVQAAAFSWDGKIILTGSGDDKRNKGEARLWDAATHEPIRDPIPHHPDMVLAVAISPDGTFATGCSDGWVRLWNKTSDKALEPLRIGSRVYAVVFSRDGGSLLTGSRDGKVRLLRRGPAGWELMYEMLHPDAVLSAIFDKTGHTILTGYAGGAQLWSADTGQKLGPPFEHAAGIRSVALSAGQPVVLTGGMDKTAGLWDAFTKKPLGPPIGHDGQVFAVGMNAQDEAILTGSFDGKARLWERQDEVPGDPEQVVRWVQVVTGIEMRGDGSIRVLDAPRWNSQAQDLEAKGGAPSIEKELTTEMEKRPLEARKPVLPHIPRDLRSALPQQPAQQIGAQKAEPDRRPVVLDPIELIERAIQRMGGEARLAKLQTASWKGVLITRENGQGTTADVSGAWQRPDKHRIRAEVKSNGKSLVLLITNGNLGWYQFDSKIDNMPEEWLGLIKDGAYVLHMPRILPNLKDQPFILSPGDETKVAGRPAVNVMVRHRLHRDVSLFFDKENGLVVKSEIRLPNLGGTEALVEIFFSDYRESNGLNLFTTITILAGEKEFTVKLTNLQPETKLDKRLFMKP